MTARVAPEAGRAIYDMNGQSDKQYEVTQPPRKKRISEVLLFVYSSVATAVILCLVIGLVYNTTEEEETNGKGNTNYDDKRVITENICYDDECVITAGSMLEAMDNKTQTPCDNFFLFTCNRWIENSILWGRYNSLLSGLSSTSRGRIKELLEKPAHAEDPEHINKSLSLYKSCMNKKAIEERGIEPLTKDIEDIGGWPVIDGDGWTGENFSITDTMIKLNKKGLPYQQIVSFDISRDFLNSTRIIFGIGEGRLGVKYRKTLFDAIVVQEYRSVLFDLAVMFGAENVTRIEQEMSDALDFEIWIANNTLKTEDYYNVTLINNYVTIKDLYNLSQEIDWLRLINSFMPSNVTMTDDLEVRVYNPQYLVSLSGKLKTTDKRTLANYIFYRTVLETCNELGWRQVAVYNRFRARVLKYGRLESYSLCMNANMGLMTYSVTSMYIKKHFSKKAKEDVTEMVDKIGQVLLKIVENIDWMDDETRVTAIKKLQKMAKFVGYPEPILNETILNDYYADVEINETEYYENLRALKLFAEREKVDSFLHYRTKSDWREHGKSYETNAYYSFSENSIEILAGIIGGSYYHIDRPKYATYGTLGIVIGHEYTHGFDNTGSLYDENGNKRNWWDNETAIRFKLKTKCMEDQYSNYSIQGIQIDGKKTLGENIADNGGTKEAYLAYQKWKKVHGDEPQLPGLPYNSNQMFWISLGTARCTEYNEDFVKYSKENEVHALNEARVNIPLMNSPYFARDFNCPAGSPMNPVKKCSVW
ncbi:ECE2 (predicted) [Pycnogonum litorale]